MKLSFQFSCGANCIHGWFLITQFLAVKLWVRIPLQIGGRQSVGTLPLFVRQLSTLCYRGILRLNLTSILCSEFYGHDWLQTCRYKTRDPWGLSVSKLFTLFVKMRFKVLEEAFTDGSLFLRSWLSVNLVNTKCSLSSCENSQGMRHFVGRKSPARQFLRLNSEWGFAC